MNTKLFIRGSIYGYYIIKKYIMVVNKYKLWEIYIFLGMYFIIKIYFLK